MLFQIEKPLRQKSTLHLMLKERPTEPLSRKHTYVWGGERVSTSNAFISPLKTDQDTADEARAQP
jgi:hypothetical protein